MTAQIPSPVSHRPLRTVLIGTSLEEESDQVVRSGLAVARAAGARICLVHAARMVVGLVETELAPDLMRERVAWCEEQLRGRSRGSGSANPGWRTPSWRKPAS